MRSWLTALAATALIMLTGPAASATVYHVSPTGPITSLKSIVNTLAPGDVVEIQPGTYREVMKITCNGTLAQPITIRGVGASRPVFDAAGLDTSGAGSIPRGVFQVEGANIIMENLEMINARNGNNGAGIRLLNSTNAVIRNCKISYCDMGMMGNDTTRALIEGCDVGFNGTPSYDGYSHNLYMGGWGDIVVRGCYIHDSLHGQNFKSRAHYNELWYNWIADSNEGEVGPVDGAETAVPNSNFLMVGNTVVSKPDRTGNHIKFVLFGHDMGGVHDGTMYMFNNTCIARDPNNAFVVIDEANLKTQAVVRNNVFVGSNKIVEYWSSALPVQGSHNWMQTAAAIPPDFTDNVLGASPGFTDPGANDYSLLAGSACIDAGTDDLWYLDGDGVRHDLVVDGSYLWDQGLIPRLGQGTIDIGAYEYGSEPPPPPPDHPTVEYTVKYLGGGKYGVRFTVHGNDGQQASFFANATFEGTAGGEVQQVQALGSFDVDNETDADSWDGVGDPPYEKDADSWFGDPFAKSPPASVLALTEAANYYHIEGGTGGGSAYEDADLAYIVTTGDLAYYGVISRLAENYDVSGVAEMPLPGDANEDGSVDGADYTTWADNYQSGGVGWAGGDFNGDDIVDGADYTIWADFYTGGGSAVPEPGCLLLAAGGALAVIRRRRP